MSTQEKEPTERVGKRTRRGLLVGAAGAAAAVAAASLAKAAPADAADGNPVLIGNVNSASTVTEIDSTSEGLKVFTNNGAAVRALGDTLGLLGTGDVGVEGQSFGGEGVLGTVTLSGTGVHGTTPDAGGYGVHGENTGSGAGVYATSASGEGAYAQSGSTAGTTPGQTQNGVHGVSDSGSGAGVFGEHMNGGAAVQGNSLSGNGKGVLGVGPIGIAGLPTSGGTALLGTTSFDGTGIAVHAAGPAQFDLSGLATIAAGKSTVTITQVSLRSGSLILATLQNKVTGIYVASAVPSVSGQKVTINLNKAVPAGKTAKVAWFVVN
jgi:hypothetical protein